MSNCCPSIEPARFWRVSAAKVVEELFRTTPEAAWDDLLDLRGLLIHGTDWEEVLECFLGCRRKLEEDHYLPFYRLRKILASHLQLEHDGASLETLLRQRDFSFRKWQRNALRKGKPARILEGVA
ncbi:hypothetical protein OVA24_09410 [Luteolibacter sp. SL250]|uniref:hypothetical protein n=1 Tax=Luteolibacter sp. SL250 TaxID=2995170 RepID=UPI00226E94AB|nr:hypothetical protein [Luteolibacter sp. SL250]WAC21600.1 hypothetical protein OVA24_09410 [Luteolibacter sp. SL250]